MTHYSKNNPRIDLYFFPYGKDAQSLSTCIIFNSGKEILQIDYVYVAKKINYSYMSYEVANKYFLNYNNCLSWSWIVNRDDLELLKLKKLKGVAGYIWRNVVVMTKKYNKNIQEIIDEISKNITAMNIREL